MDARTRGRPTLPVAAATRNRVLMEDDLFAFLEQDLTGTISPPCFRNCVLHSAELATAEWTDHEAGQEVARRSGREDVLSGYVTVLTSLARNPMADVRGVRMARILRRALDELDPPALAPAPVAPAAEPPKHRNWMRLRRVG